MSVSIFNPLGRTRSLRTSTASSNLKLTSSSSAQATSGPSYVTLFITNLRLLDLDLKEDWPDITVVTFSTKDAQQNQKKRIQGVEWALYQLFAIWDPEETRNKLQPFFPPLEPLQSLNLRTALFRCLDQAKKNGILGRDTVLRKTMLDECKGERLEEVLAVFSNAVLKKAIQNDGSGRYEALAQQLASENFSYTGERTALSALILAHKASLSRHITEKNNLRAKYSDFSGLLDLNDQRTSTRREELNQPLNDPEGHTELSDREFRSLQNKFRKNWSGSNDWLETILYGDNRPGRDGLLAKRFDILWDQIEDGPPLDLEKKNDAGLVERLEARVQNQETRLAKWQEFGRTLTRNGTKSPTKKAQAAFIEERGININFSDHHSLRIGKYTTESPKAVESSIRDEYTRLIERTQNALNDVSKPNVFCKENLAPLGSRQKFIRPSINSTEESSSSTNRDGELFTLSNASSEHSFVSSTILDAPAAYSSSHSHDNEPIITPRARISHRAVSIATSSVLPPKEASAELEVASQRLSQATKLTSNAENHYNSATPGNTRAPRHLVSTDKTQDHEQNGASIETPFSMKRRHTTTSQPSPSSSRSTQPSEVSLGPVPELSQAEQILNSMSAASPSPQKIKRSLSLADRTRLTMARSNPRYSNLDLDDEFDDLPDVDRLTLNPKLQTTPTKIPSTEEEKHADLIERTRKSMAGFEAAQKRAQLERRKSLKDEKRKQRQSHFPKIVHEEEEPIPQATPTIDREVLMDGDVDYATKDRMISSLIESGDERSEYQDEDSDEDLDEDVTMAVDADCANAFMSRPRIALSPTPARNREIMMDSELEDEGAAVNMWHDL
ncbi:hypothetical protein DID88_009255 [Monilinia fructigena]|uniref:HAUS augmin-like complex subunit 6 N-terminal domain-containing protein n=1 Tax=Monilinia fructigena TaxID=38457 RepID=A0A395IGB8_9HELO|nr:hypothetical protein DID88_009255 [Monilinia fructigena]